LLQENFFVRIPSVLLLSLFSLSAAAYDVNGVKLGGKEIDVKTAFPSVHCKELEWRTDAADRRCDDARIALGGAGGVEAKVTFYLKAGVIRAFDLRFDTKDLEKVKTLLRTRWGAPLAEATETIGARSKEQKDRKVHKMRWERGEDRAVLSAQLEKKRASVEVARGAFFDEVYKVK
jgi:hypothetical protein